MRFLTILSNGYRLTTLAEYIKPTKAYSRPSGRYRSPRRLKLAARWGYKMNRLNVYIQEVSTQIDFAKRSYESYKESETRSDIPSIFLYIHHFLIHATNIDKLLDVNPGSFRGKIISNKIDLSGIDLKPFRRLRNHLEHFDERLDNWVKNYNGYAFFDMNLVEGTKGFPDQVFC